MQKPLTNKERERKRKWELTEMQLELGEMPLLLHDWHEYAVFSMLDLL